MDDFASANKPFLPQEHKEVSCKYKLVSTTFIKWSLKTLMQGVFICWAAFIFLSPSEPVAKLFFKWLLVARGSFLSLPGGLLLICGGPIMIIVFLAFVYLALFPYDSDVVIKSKFPRFRMWTFPIFVDGPFGVVSAAELVGILLFASYVAWSVYNYVKGGLSEVSKMPDRSFIEKSSFLLEIIGVRLGSVGIYCLGFLFLPVARGSILLRLVDIPFEHAAKYHVWLGHLTMLLFTLHGILCAASWALQRKLIHELLEWKSIGVSNLAGVVSLSAGILMWVTSLYPVRKHYFELFFYTHQLYVVFVIFLAFHVGDAIFGMAAVPIFLFVLDRFLRFCQSRRVVDILSARCLSCGTLELVFSKPKRLNYNALSFIFVQIRELSFLEWHPFSVSSSPMDGDHHIAVLIKVLGGWTNNLRNKINHISEQCGEHLPVKPCHQLTASLEGPYGHECAYHLRYENLILVAGGIGISPFLAILNDIILRLKEKKQCLTKNVLVIWAVKKTEELHLISLIEANSMQSDPTNKLHLEVQAFVTQESEPPLENGFFKDQKLNSPGFSVMRGSQMSSLVGTGNIMWYAAYVIVSTLGFISILLFMEAFYIRRYGITCWWYQGLLLVLNMVASVVIFGGIVIFMWNRWENNATVPALDALPLAKEDKSTNESHSQNNQVSLLTTKYGMRPNFKDIFNMVAQNWGHIDVGVIVCGPATLQTSVAKECRSQNFNWKWPRPIYHFHSHSFDL